MNNNLFHNSYKTKRDTVLLSILILIIGFLFYAGKVAMQPTTITIYAKDAPVTAPEPISTPIPVPDDVVGYINYKFGEHATKAFQVLQDPKCHENLKLDPFAVNDNTTWGGNGRDRGIFQISDYWHPTVTDAMAFDFKQNIDYAYRMFVNDGFRFDRWTCGKYLGI